MIFEQKTLFVFMWGCCALCSADYDVASVSFRGDCTTFGMRIERTYFDNGVFSIVTTGARFEYVAGELKIYQGLGDEIDTKRLIAIISIEGATKFDRAEANDDRVLLHSENLNIGIYGDSTCILALKEKMNVKFTGSFKPDYEGRYKGELLLIDDSGGMEIYPQRYETGYEIKKIELGKKDWTAEYVLNANERVMIAAFPSRPFDWEESFNSNIVITYGGMGLGTGNTYGQMPSDYEIRQWSRKFDIIVMFYQGLYKNVKPSRQYPYPAGPYTIANEPEFRRLVKIAHECGMKVAPYCSLFYHYQKFKDVESFYNQIKELRRKYQIDGVYVDGLMFDGKFKIWRIDDKISNWEMIRRLRHLFGADGVIVLHDTQLGSPVGTVPNIDSYCTATLNGEGVPFESFEEPYVKYQVRKYGISNTIGLWKKGRHPSSLDKYIIDAELEMNCRKTWGSYVPIKEPPPNNKYTWRTNIDGGYYYYRRRLAQLRDIYHKQKVWRTSDKER